MGNNMRRSRRGANGEHDKKNKEPQESFCGPSTKRDPGEQMGGGEGYRKGPDMRGPLNHTKEHEFHPNDHGNGFKAFEGMTIGSA